MQEKHIDRIDAAFSKGEQEQRALFISYLSAGDPNFDTSLDACRALIDGGTDIIELGLPFSDPLADGLTNQLAAQRALDAGIDTEAVFRLVREIRKFSQVPVVLYVYYNMEFSYGEEAFVKAAKEAGVDALLTLDLPPEEAGDFLQVCKQYQMKTVSIVAPTTPRERIKLISEHTTGFLYYASLTGVTGERKQVAADLEAKVKQIREMSELPVVVGFGVSKSEHVQQIAKVANGIVVGSCLVNCIAKNLGDHDQIVGSLNAKVRELTASGAALAC